MAQHPTTEPQADPLDPEGTDARWEPLPDEEWAALTASLEPASDTEASRRVDEWLEPAATVVRRAPVEAARPAAPLAGDTVPDAASPRNSRTVGLCPR